MNTIYVSFALAFHIFLCTRIEIPKSNICGRLLYDLELIITAVATGIRINVASGDNSGSEIAS